jgi:hypothetical protein
MMPFMIMAVLLMLIVIGGLLLALFGWLWTGLALVAGPILLLAWFFYEAKL